MKTQAEYERRRWKTYTKLTEPLYERRNDDWNDHTLGMVPPTSIERPVNEQRNDQWTEHHKDDQCAAQAIQNEHTTNVLQMPTRRALREELPSHNQLKPNENETGNDASPP